MIANTLPAPTAVSGSPQAPATPSTTAAPIYPKVKELVEKDATVGKNTCGWINGDPASPYSCSATETCVGDPEYSAMGCCDSDGGCGFYTSCMDADPGICYSSVAGDCFHYDWTVGCVDYSPGGCVTYTFAGATPFTYVDCTTANPGIVTIQTTYAGMPANQQIIPMPYSAYLVSASGASAAATSGGSGSDSSDALGDATNNSWLQQHKNLLIGVLAAFFALLVLSSCFCSRRIYVKRKERLHVVPIQVPAGPAPRYQYAETGYAPEHVPMTQQYSYVPKNGR